MISTPSTMDSWTQCEATEADRDVQCRRATERAEFFKEMLEFTEQSYSALEARLTEHASTEATLRATVAEYEKIDRIQADRMAALEIDNQTMAARIEELEKTIADTEVRIANT